MIILKNRLKQPLVIEVGGEGVHFSPNQSIQLSKNCLELPLVKRYLDKGIVIVEHVPRNTSEKKGSEELDG